MQLPQAFSDELLWSRPFAPSSAGHPDHVLFAPKSALGPALARISEMWRTHIALEEAHFGPDAVGASLTMEERRRAGRVASSHAARHQRRLALMLPFLLYNMTPEDRAVMSQLMPPVVPLLLWMWKPRWRVMAPFLLVDA